MGLLFHTTLLDVGALAACLLAVVYIYFKLSFSYWKKRKVPYVEPTFPFGNFRDLMFLKRSVGHVKADIYMKLDGEKYGGSYMFTKPEFIFRDPDIIKNVLVKDFANFHDRGFFADEELEPLTAHLFFLSGKRWRNLRVKLTPTFTSGKMKMMFQTLVDCGQELGITLEEPAHNEEIIEIKDILARYSTDIISSCAFGIESNSLKNPDAEFRQWGRKIFEPTMRSSLIRTLAAVLPPMVSLLKLRALDPKISKYFRGMFQDTVNFREKNNIKRNDFMQLLIQMKNREKLEDEHDYLEQNGHRNLQNKSGDNGMYLSRVFQVNIHIRAYSSMENFQTTIGVAKNAVFWDVTNVAILRIDVSEEGSASIIQVTKIDE
jgi:cytochrome P450 family 6